MTKPSSVVTPHLSPSTVLRPDLKVPLGRSGLNVSRLGVGCGTLALAEGSEQALATLDAAWRAGLRYFDTAPLYVGSEELLGAFLASKDRAEAVVATKIGRSPALAGARRFAFDQSTIAGSLDLSFGRLGTDRLDLVSIHDLTRAMLTDGYDQARRDLDATLPYLERLKAEGRIGALAVAVYDPADALELLRLGTFDVIMIVGAYTLLSQAAQAALLPYCQARNIGVVVASPYHTGVLVTGAVANASFNFRPASEPILDLVRKIEAVCQTHGVPLPAAALQFPLRHPAISSVMVGQSAPSELADNVSWAKQPIPEEFWNDIARLQNATPIE